MSRSRSIRLCGESDWYAPGAGLLQVSQNSAEDASARVAAGDVQGHAGLALVVAGDGADLAVARLVEAEAEADVPDARVDGRALSGGPGEGEVVLGGDEQDGEVRASVGCEDSGGVGLA